MSLISVARMGMLLGGQGLEFVAWNCARLYIEFLFFSPSFIM